MWDRFTNALDLAITTNAQGMFLFVLGTIIMSAIHLIHAKAFVTGLKGENHLWESPEILTYLITWLLPEFLMADAWLGLRLSDAGYLILGEIVLFALMGRLGLEYMLSLRGRTITEKKIEIKQTDTKKENPEASTSGPEIL
jgi:small-conductance mechanosensitive channel